MLDLYKYMLYIYTYKTQVILYTLKLSYKENNFFFFHVEPPKINIKRRIKFRYNSLS